MREFRHGSLFSGIGGFDLAAEWMGWENVFHCEWNPFGQKILKYYWPNAKSYGDITKTDFTEWSGKVDIVSGGFPCQPYSTAGKRKGKADDRHLWPEMLRAIREIQPSWIVGENVPGLLNWERGMVLAEIKADLESSGFEVFPSLVLPACGKDAPHKRDRVWIVAHSNGNDNKGNTGFRFNTSEKGTNKSERNKRERVRDGLNGNGEAGIITNSERIRQQGQGWAEGQMRTSWAYADGRWTTQPPICSGNDGFSGKLDGITFSKHRKESLIGYGNAIVPQVAYEIFKAIEEINERVSDR